MLNRILSSKWTKGVVFLLGLSPLLVLLWFVYQLDLTANPLEYITHYTGDWTLRFFMITLAVTPLRVMLNRPAVTRFRRMLGLYVFFYACLHLLCYAWFDMGLEWDDIVADIPKRPFILVGFLTWLLLTVLAVGAGHGLIAEASLGAAAAQPATCAPLPDLPSKPMIAASVSSRWSRASGPSAAPYCCRAVRVPATSRPICSNTVRSIRRSPRATRSS